MRGMGVIAIVRRLRGHAVGVGTLDLPLRARVNGYAWTGAEFRLRYP
jgi:hypothetical protein